MTPPPSKASGSDVLDVLIVGGGPAGTAPAFRSKELGLRLLVIDFDDVLKRIRDYPKDKLILPDFGGGDRMAFPAGGECVTALQFEPIDKDDIVARWKGLYKQFDIPVRIGVELQSFERQGDLWHVHTWDHKQGEKVVFQARHVVLAIGRGVPRRLDISGNTDGIAYRMDDPAKYVEGPVLVVGGGTSAAEAVLSISKAKIAADEGCNVYWAFRGSKLPRVSKALADVFFEAYMGNGNIRSLPDGEPQGVVTGPDRVELLSVRVDRKTPEGRPPETVHLEFHKNRVIACIGEDIPEALLLSLGIPMVPVGDGKKMLVSPILETVQPSTYLIGDLLSQSYLETNRFNGSAADESRQVKHRGNIKTSLRDGVFVAEVVKQRLEGRAKVDVVIKDATPAVTSPRRSGINRMVAEADVVAPATAPEASEEASLVLMTPTGVEAGEFRIKPEGTTTIGRIERDIAFPQDAALSDAHASISIRNGEYFLRDDGSRSGTYLRLRPDRPMIVGDGDLLRAGRQLLVVSRATRGAPPTIEHFNANGQQIGVYPIKGTTVFGRAGGKSNPDVILDDADATLSRFHMSVSLENDVLQAQDFASKNGTYLKIDAERKLDHGDIIRVGAQQLVVRLRDELPEKKGSAPVPVVEVDATPLAPVPPPAPPPPAPVAAPAPRGAAAPAGPHVTVQGQGKAGSQGPPDRKTVR
jgi:thioredoxin reductase/pSer/pThr/pTyr-binding forkhead associated (FHA) protein